MTGILIVTIIVAIIAVSLTVSPAFSHSDKKLTSEFGVPDIESAVLKDVVKANGKKTYWDLTATLDGNLVQSTKNLNGDSKGAGVMIKPDNEHVYTVGVHTYNNCVNFDCANYLVHGHVSQLKEAASDGTCFLAGYEFESIPGTVRDLGTGHITYKKGQDKTVISLVNIDATENNLADPADVCDNSQNPDVGDVYLYNTRVIVDSETHLCVHLSDPVTLKNTSINGFTSAKTPSLCE
jgi:hypothetical protein